MKKVLAFICSIFIVFSTPVAGFSLSSESVAATGFEPPAESLGELYRDISLSLLTPQIDKVLEEYYGGFVPWDPWGAKVLYIERPNGYRTFFFRIKVQVGPYIGAHNTIGIDNITLTAGAGGDIVIEKFEHIKSFEPPPHLRSH